MKRKKIDPVFFVSIIFVLLMAFTVVLHFLVPIKICITTPYNWLGVGVMLSGSMLNLKADRLLQREKDNFGLIRSLVKVSVYQYSRHPMYLGMFFVLLGTALFFTTLSSFFVPLLFLLLLHFFVIPYEERDLLILFPEEYSQYKNSTRCWL